MGRNRILTIGGCIILIILLFIGLVYEIKKVPDLNWASNLDYEDKDPYDAFVFAQLLNERYGSDNVSIKDEESELDTLNQNQLYISLGQNITFNNEDERVLKKFIEAGNNAIFIGSDIEFTLPLPPVIRGVDLEDSTATTYYYPDEDEPSNLDNEDDVVEEYHEENDQQYDDQYDENSDDSEYNQYDEIDEDNIASDTISRSTKLNTEIISFTDSILNFDFVPFDSAANQYSYKHYYDDFERAKFKSFSHFYNYAGFEHEPIIYAKNNVSICSKIELGEGNLYVHTVPDLFSNAATRQSFYLDHFNNVFSQINADKVLLDKPDPFSSLFDRSDNKSPLQYILGNPSLSWAYYLLLATLILFVIFRGKRTQRIIPTMQKNTNTSMDYIKALSTLYQKQKQNSKLVRHMRDGFYHRIKSKYYIDHKDEFFVEKLTAKSKIDAGEISNLTHKLNSTTGAEFTDDQLIILYNQIESFYKKAK